MPHQKPHDRYLEIIKTMPHNLKKGVISIVSWYEGKDNTVPKQKIAAEINKMGLEPDKAYSTLERQIRDTIQEINLDEGEFAEIIILGSTGEGGYYIPASWEEYSEYDAVEQHRADEIENKLVVMRRKALKMFRFSNAQKAAQPAKQARFF